MINLIIFYDQSSNYMLWSKTLLSCKLVSILISVTIRFSYGHYKTS